MEHLKSFGKTSFCALALFLCNGLALTAFAAAEKAWNVDLSEGKGGVTFNALGRPSALKIVGKGAAPKGSFSVKGTKVTGDAAFDLSTLDTGIKMRNEHMKKKYLEIEKFPTAKLTVQELTLTTPIDASTAAQKVPFKGTINIHGVDKPVAGTSQIEKKGADVSVTSDFELKTSDFAISTPSFAGITMAESVTVNVQFTAPLKPAAAAAEPEKKTEPANAAPAKGPKKTSEPKYR
jgi:polyisoprenoid-binding protein YceI